MQLNDQRKSAEEQRQTALSRAKQMKETNESERVDRLARMRSQTSARKDALHALPRGDTDVAKLVRTRLLPEETLQLRSVREVCCTHVWSTLPAGTFQGHPCHPWSWRVLLCTQRSSTVACSLRRRSACSRTQKTPSC